MFENRLGKEDKCKRDLIIIRKGEEDKVGCKKCLGKEVKDMLYNQGNNVAKRLKKQKDLKSLKELFNEKKHVNLYIKEYKKESKDFQIISSLKNNKEVLSLGCGAGREVKELVKKGHGVVAIDFCENMINKSKDIEPKAIYYCMDVIDFVRKNKNKIKFDYILGLFSFFNYIKKEDRIELINNLVKMLNKDGKIIFELRRTTERIKDVVKIIINPYYCFKYNRKWEFGDVYSSNVFSHFYTEKQLRVLLKGYNYEINRNKVYIFK